MTYKKPTPEYIQIIADDVAWRKEQRKKDQAFKNKLRNYLIWSKRIREIFDQG